VEIRIMAQIIDFFEKTPHVLSELICIKCRKRWIGARPEGTRLKDLECPKCHKQGFIIETGEALESDD
jgi:Zn finger protein HypA/HybF involved in hydrogenase expression